jgi:hypothetical protein
MKYKTKKEKNHLSRVAQTGCAVCFRLHGPHEPGPVELHHPRRGTGMGQRASHEDVIGLCIEHHRGNLGVHGLGTKGFTKHYGFTEEDLLHDVNKRLQKEY